MSLGYVNTPSIILRINSMVPQMTSSMHKIASFISQNFNDLDGISIEQLAQKSEVSISSVTRFVKLLGFNNYQTFVLTLAKDIAVNHEKFTYSSIKQEDDIETLCHKIFDVNLKCIQDTYSIINTEEMQKAADAVVESNNIIIVAQGRSVVTASSLTQRLRRIGYLPNLLDDPHEAIISSSYLKEGDVLFGISTYGQSSTTVNSVQQAQENGAKTIAITSYMNTPLEMYSDIILQASNNENLTFGDEPSCATMAQMILIDCLYQVLYMKEKQHLDGYIEETVQKIRQYNIDYRTNRKK